MDFETLLAKNAVNGLKTAIELSNAMVRLRKEHAIAILELLKKQQKTGHWIKTGFGYSKCSECCEFIVGNIATNYCPNCGAKMNQ